MQISALEDPKSSLSPGGSAISSGKGGDTKGSQCAVRLAELMMDFGVGATTANTYAVKKLVLDYFGED